MGDLRKPLFFMSLFFIALVVLVEIGSGAVLPGTHEAISADLVPGDRQEAFEDLDAGDLAALSDGRPPGLAISYMALLDSVALFTAVLMGVSLLIPKRVHGRVQGCATLMFAVLLILGGLALIFVALGLLIFMVALILSFFGFFSYLALYGFFDRTGAEVLLSLLMALKLGFGGFLVAAQPRFLQNKGLVLIVLTSLLANVIIGFLHGLVPRLLVSITDAVAAIVVGILAVIWAVILLFGSLGSVAKAVRPDRV